MRWMYAHYRMGGFDVLPRDLSAKEFTAALVELSLRSSEVVMLSREGKPRGLVLINWSEAGFGEVHVEWMEWASPRDKVEGAVQFFESRKDQMFITVADAELRPFHNRLCLYGLLRKVGEVYGMLNGEDAVMYQSARRCH